MIEKIQALWPEIALFVTACVVMVIGLSPSAAVRRLCGVVTGLGLLAAGALAYTTPAVNPALPGLALYGKAMVAGIGLVLLLLASGTVDREYESFLARGGEGAGGQGRAEYEPLRSTKGEFYAFFLFSLTGLMLTAGATDLVWLFLALELTSLPTYVMVTISSGRDRSMEAGVKYFFLGAMGAATFLYGFAMLYGGTGTTSLGGIANALAAQRAAPGGQINPIAMLGLVLSVVGIGFKIAAVPMHFYTADVYQGASPSVAGFLAFVPKAAGFFALLSLCAAVGWGPTGDTLVEPLRSVLWVMAALTMTVGNALAVVQTSLRRVLAYSSVAHSGYMLVGVIAGPGPAGGGTLMTSGVAAVLFYLLAYGLTNAGSFAVLGCLERVRPDGQAEELDSIEDVRGLCQDRPLLGWALVLSVMSLLGLPPLLGFFAKLPLFGAGLNAGEYALVVVLALNSAVAAFYYLRVAAAAVLEPGQVGRGPVSVRPTTARWRPMAAFVSAAGVVALAIYPVTGWALFGARQGADARSEPAQRAAAEPALPSDPHAASVGATPPAPAE
ncbi:MAG: hypothetical protein C0475_03075 [Planctomyces sp.]|nr:hypothetical protein [Planctomyces sp.]